MSVSGLKKHILRKGQRNIALAKVIFWPKVFGVGESNDMISFLKFGTDFLLKKGFFYEKNAFGSYRKNF